MPKLDWFCPKCLVGTGEYGFEEGAVYSLRKFQEKANGFRDHHFAGKIVFDPVLNKPRQASEDDVEREFWRLVESKEETVEVEYGADIHSTTHGSGFPTLERNPTDPYARDPWNLNILPHNPQSLFRYVKSNISGMTVPWLYVGMVFSTFCWHAEDHNTYSANYQHFGATKTWYGIPGDDARKFEDAMREAVPELFDAQPDLLFQLVTLLTPEQLKKAGVRVYAVDQRAGQFVVTFPQAYHAGFNHGFNFNEAVNFAPTDWEPFGEAGALRLQEFRRQPCFSHDELLMTAAAQKDISIKMAKWLGPALQRMLKRERETRMDFMDRHYEYHTPQPDGSIRCTIHLERSGKEGDCSIDYDPSDKPEDEISCAFCKSYAYLSRYLCKKTGKVMCMLHAGLYECCNFDDPYRHGHFKGDAHRFIEKVKLEDLEKVVDKIMEKANVPEAWVQKLDKLLEDEPRPSLRSLQSLLSEGDKIAWPIPQLAEFRRFVERCNAWVEKAQGYITRRQQNRRKNERAWRKSTSKKDDVDDREAEYRKVEKITQLLKEADELSFDCPAITTLRERAESIEDFQKKAETALKQYDLLQAALGNYDSKQIEELDELVELGKSYNVDMPEMDRLDKFVQRLKWYEIAKPKKSASMTMQEVSDLIDRAQELELPMDDGDVFHFKQERQRGIMWNNKALELLNTEPVHYQQLDALSRQANTIPITPDTLARIDAVLKKQRDAQDQIVMLYQRSQNPDFNQRPKYKEVRDAMQVLEELQHKPPGTIDLEKEQKRQEDWMRRGKKLFGKANAPLHILLSHMKLVEEKNKFCFDTSDQPRMPVEPASRANSPDENEPTDGSNSVRDVFCICRRPEAGMMIECELCHEWYHGRCLKIARGKVKEDDKYTCPICDHRVKIPRDAARPKLEDLQAWQDEIPSLPFQPEEEKTLESIINTGMNFREFVGQYINPMLSNPDELTTQRFYLRKLEGADILLAPEINFFRRELHRWAPVAPEPPPVMEVSLSTRKPRPTKQQKLMTQLGITNPDDLPENLRPKHSKKRQHTDATGRANNPEHVVNHLPLGAVPNDGARTPPGPPPRDLPYSTDTAVPRSTTSSFFDAHRRPSTSGQPISAGTEPFSARSSTFDFNPTSASTRDSPNLHQRNITPTTPNLFARPTTSPPGSPPFSANSANGPPLDPPMFADPNFSSSSGSGNAAAAMGEFLKDFDGSSVTVGGNTDINMGDGMNQQQDDGGGFREAIEAMGEGINEDVKMEGTDGF
jgi:[histone H3]-trimethyl-L-lysine4 demethylase